MDKDRINHLIDNTTPEMLDRAIKAIAEMPESEFERIQVLHERKMAKKRDKEALESEMGIERITVFLRQGGSILLIKPNKWTDPNVWTFNLYEAGTICIRTDQEPEFKVGAMPMDGLYRLHVGWGESVYWVDLIDEQQAKDLAEFLGVEITPFDK
ncbi:hypothetical protein [Vibrio europaeus]|uniref:hypothetical protein n=1 Tax=Vibrio europaeus TaxID=300876 RepID=UPI00233EDAEF|nr:hypothetical protein [Vibrio europaeus]MDC5753567.1 hypothetical protein [Vibrio europaeus]MDC5816521.1 hypothetical protein [Vibrio europaeus]